MNPWVALIVALLVIYIAWKAYPVLYGFVWLIRQIRRR